ncbi:MAG: 16S rRNA processing protein RimM [Alphaproteobacteria bacterium]|nr:16S rRNA processing protein RimM [Alphaproteobacteria bacterium]
MSDKAKNVQTETDRICVGVIGKAHGLHGQVKVTSFTDCPEDITAYGLLENSDGTRKFKITIVGKNKEALRAKIDGVSNRDEAEKLNGEKLFVSRQLLPETEDDEFYYTDLIGLETCYENGELAGKINAVHNFGAGDLLEIKKVDNSVEFIAFTKEAVPKIDIKNGLVVIKQLDEKAEEHDEDRNDNKNS